MQNFEKVVKAAEEAMSKLGEFLQEFRTGNKNKKVQLEALMPGEKFKTDIGNFIVLDQLEEKTLVIAEKLMREEVQFDTSCRDYNKSDLKELCDGEIYEEFANTFGAENIVEHEVDLITVDGQQLYEKAKCKVRPLNFDEARKHNQYLINKELGDWYWTCTSWSSEERGWEYSMAVVAPSGYFNDCSYDDDYGVRPFCILKSNIFVSKED